MSKQVHWLWPSNKHTLASRHERRNINFQSVEVNPQDILFPGSDDESDIDRRCAKKRRIERLANHYLSGKTLFISTASLKGPFGSAPRISEDKYAHYIVGSPLLPDPVFLSKGDTTQRPITNKSCLKQTLHSARDTATKISIEHDVLPSPAQPSSLFKDSDHRPAQTPEPDSADDSSRSPSASVATPSRTPHKVPTDIVVFTSEPALLPHSAGSSTEATKSAHLISDVMPLSAPSDEVREGSISKRGPCANSAGSQQNADDVLKPLCITKEPEYPPITGFTPINGPTLTSPGVHTVNNPPLIKSTGKLPKVNALREKRRRAYLEAVSHGDESPLMIRRKTGSRCTASPLVTAEIKAIPAPVARTSKPKPRKILFDSSVNIPSQRHTESQSTSGKLDSSGQQPPSQPKSSTRGQIDKVAPAIDISFDQGSLAMNFDLIDNHSKSLSPASNSAGKRSMTEQLQRSTHQSRAVFNTTSHVPELNPEPQEKHASGQMEESCVLAEHIPSISTQAAMEEAHRALFDTSSPAKAVSDSTTIVVAHTGPTRRISKPPISITPFRDFNAKMAADFAPGTSAAPANTQALFDNMSPFLTPDEPRKGASKRRKRTSFASANLDETSVAVAASPSVKTDFQAISANSTSKDRNKDVDTDELLSASQLDGTSAVQDRHGSQSDNSIVPNATHSQRDEEQSVLFDGNTTQLAEKRILSPVSTSVPSTAQKRPNKRSRRTPKSHRRRSSGKHDDLPNSSSAVGTLNARSIISTSEPLNLSTLTPKLSSKNASHALKDPSDASQSFGITKEDDTLADTSQTSAPQDAPLSVVDKQHPVTHTPLDMTDVDMTMQTTSARRTKQISTPASSFQYAQRVDDADLDNTIDSITRTVLSSWDVEKAMRNPVDASA